MCLGSGEKFVGIMFSGVDSRFRVLELDDSEMLDCDDLIEVCNSAPNSEAIYVGRNLIFVVNYKGRALAVKSFAVPWGPRRLIYGCLRATKASRSFKNAKRLVALGLFTPKPVGYLESGGKYLLHRSFYVSEYMTSSSGRPVTLREILLDPLWPDRTNVLRDFGRYTYLLHEKGVCHKDYSPGNILVSRFPPPHEVSLSLPMQPPLTPRFDLLDLNRMTFGRMNLNQRMRNFRLLWAEDQDLKTIIQGYAEASKESAEILFRLAEKISHQHKRSANREELWKQKLRTLFRTNKPNNNGNTSSQLNQSLDQRQ